MLRKNSTTNKSKPARSVTLSPDGEVLDSSGKVVRDNPAGGRYKWIKIDVQAWLMGTTRWMCTAEQVTFLIDLICNSGAGRFPGWCCSGQDAGKMVGFPLAYYESWRPYKFNVLEAFAVFAKKETIRVHITRDEEPKLYAVEILNWAKFQSDIDSRRAIVRERVRKFREKKKEQA
jgi:hypothetical protein